LLNEESLRNASTYRSQSGPGWRKVCVWDAGSGVIESIAKVTERGQGLRAGLFSTSRFLCWYNCNSSLTAARGYYLSFISSGELRVRFLLALVRIPKVQRYISLRDPLFRGPVKVDGCGCVKENTQPWRFSNPDTEDSMRLCNWRGLPR
jgi:hypothetical protein